MTRSGRLHALRERVRSWPGGHIAWRTVVTLVGAATVVVGVILLPLPGPGWVIIFAGLGILATEYAWAADLLHRARRFFMTWKDWFAKQPRWIHVVGGLFGLLVLAGFVAVGVLLI